MFGMQMVKGIRCWRTAGYHIVLSIVDPNAPWTTRILHVSVRMAKGQGAGAHRDNTCPHHLSPLRHSCTTRILHMSAPSQSTAPSYLHSTSHEGYHIERSNGIDSIRMHISFHLFIDVSYPNSQPQLPPQPRCRGAMP